jgi:tetratricopeptide (TPR) repeat protein
VSEKLKARLSGDDQAKVSKKDTADPEAYQLYLKGRFYWSKRTGDSLKQASEYFNKAIEKDPQYALAYSGLAESYSLYNSFNVASGKDSMPQAKAAAMKALELDDSIAPAHAALGNYFANYAWNPEASEKELRRAIEIDPNYATAYHWLGNITLQTLGRFDESITAGRKAEELDPLSPIIVADVGQNMFMARRFDDAIPQLKKSLNVEPTFSYAIYFLGACYHAKGMYQEAIAEYRRSLAIDDDTYARGLLVRSLVKAGQRSEAEKELGALEQTARSRYVPSTSLAIAYASLGRMDDAFVALDKEFEDRPTMFIYMRYDPSYDDLRSDPRFDKLLQRISAAKIE